MDASIREKIKHQDILDEKDTIKLLQIENFSPDFYELLCVAQELTRKEFHNIGYVFAQIGLDAHPCSVDCAFCSMGKSHYSLDATWKKTPHQIVEEVSLLVQSAISDLFLMTSADYPQDEFLSIASLVREKVPQNIRLVANIGDFTLAYAKELQRIGVTGAYHIKRLGEGVVTKASESMRIATIEAIMDAKLELYYCVEPIGPEHTYEEIAREIIRARDYRVGVMAVMRRIAVPGTPLFSLGQISSVELTKIAAVTRIVTQPHRAMNAHETVQMSLLAGVNQLYAELGANPRDVVSHTEQHRGLSVIETIKLLEDAGFSLP